jgi:hypothetical protein
MNLRFVTGLFAAVALLPMALTSSIARADVPAVPSDVPITAAAKTSLNQSTYADEITQKVSAEVQKMAENASDAGTVKMTREWLVAENPPAASAPYQQNYAAALNAAFMNVLGQGDPPVNFRINTGIVISKLSGPKESLAPTVIKLLQDKCAAVVLWGNRAAGAMFPLAMRNPNGTFSAAGGVGSKVLDAIVASLSAHLDGPMSGDIADAAFKAVNPRFWDVEKGVMPPSAAMAMLADANLKMQSARIDVYKNTGVPENPLADTYPSYLLLKQDAWSGMTQQQQLQAAQNAVDLVSLMGQRFVNKAANPNQDLMTAIQELGRWIQELGARLNNPGVQAAGNQVKTLNPTMPAKTITDACDSVYAALQNDPAMGQLTAPPNLSAPASPAAKSGTDASTGSTPTSLAPQ